jgi:hypothetical protein
MIKDKEGEILTCIICVILLINCDKRYLDNKSWAYQEMTSKW